MNKITNEGWPDPTDWVGRLKSELQDNELQYRAFLEIHRGVLDPEEFENPELMEREPIDCARLQMAKTIAILSNALKELPAFSANEGLAPISDLLAHMVSLADGLQPEIFKPSIVKSSTEPMSRIFLQRNVIFCVRSLEKMGLKNGKARERVAKLFAEAGHVGRKQARSLSAKTIYQWQCNIEGEPKNSAGKRHIDKWLANWTKLGVFELTIADVEKEIAKIAADPLLTTKI